MERKKSFTELRKDCLIADILYKDPSFQPSDKILKLMKMNHSVQWRRPGEIRNNPQFVFQGFSREDVHQGGLGDCWFLAALSTLTQNPELFAKVVPADNDNFENNYAGIFHFR